MIKTNLFFDFTDFQVVGRPRLRPHPPSGGTGRERPRTRPFVRRRKVGHRRSESSIYRPIVFVCCFVVVVLLFCCFVVVVLLLFCCCCCFRSIDLVTDHVQPLSRPTWPRAPRPTKWRLSKRTNFATKPWNFHARVPRLCCGPGCWRNCRSTTWIFTTCPVAPWCT
jgi:hypothetical protein